MATKNNQLKNKIAIERKDTNERNKKGEYTYY